MVLSNEEKRGVEREKSEREKRQKIENKRYDNPSTAGHGTNQPQSGNVEGTSNGLSYAVRRVCVGCVGGKMGDPHICEGARGDMTTYLVFGMVVREGQ